jgi:hypothetical protein
MVKYTGDEVEVRVAATENGLDTADVLTNVSSVEWNENPGIQKPAVGLGSRLKEVHETLLDYDGSIERWHDEVAVAGSSNFRTAVGAFQQGALPALYVEIKNKTSGKKVRFKKCKGPYSAPAVTPEGFMTETWNFDFEDISET